MLEFTKKPKSAALAFIIVGAVWFIVGSVYGLITAVHLVNPEFFNNIPALVFGRSRPAHVNTVAYGFIGMTLIGACLYMVPAVLKTRLWSERLGWVSWLLWNISVLSGPITFAWGISQGREYAEYIWIFDVAIVLSILLMIYNLSMTIAARVERDLYVTVWYVFGAFMWTAGAYVIGNVMWRPSTGAMPGIIDSIFLWFWGHDLPGLFVTPLATGAAYFVIPRVTRTPLYSHTLSLIGFWMLVALYTHIGGHHILQAPIPNWLKVMSVVDSAAMILPVFTVIANLWLTSRGHGARLWEDPAGRFVMMGIIWYIITCIQGPLQSLPQVQKVTHFNNWTVGHAHIAVLGFAGFIAMGAVWHVLPLILGRKVYSSRLVNIQFGLIMIGLAGFFVTLTIAGLIQGSAWNNGEMVYRVLPEVTIWMALRLAFGVFIVAAAFVGLYNIIMTIRRGEPLAASAGREGSR